MEQRDTSNRCKNGRRRGRNDQPLFHYSQAEAYRALPACPIQMLRRMRASSREPCRHHPLRRVLEYSCLSLFRSTPPCPQPLGIHLRCRHAIDQFFKSIKRLIVIHPVVELHILASSPYFQGSFTTLSDKSVELEDNHITTTEGSLALREIRHHSHNL